MADTCNLEIDNAGLLPRVGGVTSQDGVVWIGGPETRIDFRGAGFWATHHPAAAAGGGGAAAPERFMLK